MRGALCVIRVIVVGAALSACSNSIALPTTQPGSTPSVAVSQSPTPLSVQPPLESMGTVCSGDVEPPIIAPGWKLLWQRMFEYQIARPPVVDGRQALLIERADARWTSIQDNVVLVDAQTGNIQWNDIEAKDPIPHVSRDVLSIQYSPKYWLLLLRYMKPEGSPNPPSMQYELVVDRQSGKVIYDSGANATGSATTMALGGDVLFDHFSGSGGVFAYEYMRRIDLSMGQAHWMQAWGAYVARGMVVVDNNLYVFADEKIGRYDPSDGHLIASTKFNLYPSLGDLIFEGNLAVIRSERGLGVFDLQSFSGVWRTLAGDRPGTGSNAFGNDLPSMFVTLDSIYMFDAQNTLSRFDLHTGKLVWQVSLPSPQAMSRPVVMNGLVFALFADGTVRAFAETDGAPAGVVGQFPVWYWTSTDTREWLDLVGGLGVSDDTLIVTTGCRSVYAIQRAP